MEEWFSGVVAKVNDDETFDIIYDEPGVVGSPDGLPCDWNVDKHLIRPKTIELSTLVEVDYSNERGGLAPGAVSGVNDDGLRGSIRRP